MGMLLHRTLMEQGQDQRPTPSEALGVKKPEVKDSKKPTKKTKK